MYSWSFRYTDKLNNVSETIIEQIHHTFLNGFSLKQGWSLEGIKYTLRNSNVIGFLTNKKHAHIIEGYAFYSIPSAKLYETHVLWEDAICLKKYLQGKGLASFRVLLKEMECLIQDKTIGWLGGRTQNPVVLARYAKLGTLYPIDVRYTDKIGRNIIKFLLKNINEVKEIQARLEHDTGICRNFYSEGKLGDYPTTGETAKQFEPLLQQWRFNRSAGDALIAIVRLNKPIEGTTT
ncbi:hypothetical protein U27_01606 [Candidatus Vecturithrix granuli]|uniref:N-acetyltransferase domain-containing protein n=1 Tax=Vecturithrix granuli TaxID=1499967 RepID=A0A0S6W588_VECG1|nr:hypothetical protein U27_01606 [Candidatus Vecturithrix granuli]